MRLRVTAWRLVGTIALISVIWLGGCAAPREDHDLALQEQIRDFQRRVDALERDKQDSPLEQGRRFLQKFPPPEWSEERLQAILKREITEGVYRNDDEREFIDNFPLWKKALEASHEGAQRSDSGR